MAAIPHHSIYAICNSVSLGAFFRHCFCSLLLFPLIQHPLQATSKNTPRVLAQIRKHIITTEDVKTRCRLMSLWIPRDPGVDLIEVVKQAHIQQQALQSLVQEAMKNFIVDRFKIKIEDKKVKEYIHLMDKENHQKPGFLLEKARALGLEQQLIDFMRIRLQWKDYMTLKYRASIHVTEGDVKRFQEEWRKKQKEKFYRVLEICLFLGKRGSEKDKEGEEKMAFIQSQLQQGAHFATLAQHFSQDPRTQNQSEEGEWKSLSQFHSLLQENIKKIDLKALPLILGPMTLENTSPRKKVLLAVLEVKQEQTIDLPSSEMIRESLHQQSMAKKEALEIENLIREFSPHYFFDLSPSLQK